MSNELSTRLDLDSRKSNLNETQWEGNSELFFISYNTRSQKKEKKNNR